MKKIIKWIKWLFYDSVVCEHEKDNGTLVDWGRGKVWRCKKCGKILDRL